MRQICKFNDVRDITPTNPALDPDVFGSIRAGIVKDTATTTFYNMQTDPSEVGVRVNDLFDVIEYENALRLYRREVEDGDKDE